MSDRDTIESLVTLLIRADARLMVAEAELEAERDETAALQGEIERLKACFGLVTLADIANAWRHYKQTNTELWQQHLPHGHWKEFENFVVCMNTNQRINAIKSLRTMTKCGLKDGKEFVEDRV